MTKWRKAFYLLLFILAAVVLVIVGFVVWFFWASADVGAGYSAKLLASGIFVAGRTPESVASQELGFMPFLRYSVDMEGRTVTARTAFGRSKTAVYRDGLGVAIAHDGDIEAIRRQARPDLIAVNEDAAALPWPMGDAPSGNPRPPGMDEARLTAAGDRMFEEPSRFRKLRTRAVLVVYQDEIVYERYGEGVTHEQRFPAWSMTKSIVHALYGIAVRDGKISIEQPAPLWPDKDDPRSAITIDMMLRMSSGLKFGEFDFLPPTDLTTMLFLRPGAGAYAAEQPLAHPVDTVWAYASGTTNMLSLILRQTYGDDAYYALPYRELFDKIGMRSTVMEADASGAFIGSSFCHATARDYARFGLLYAHDGVWQGERILPERWVAYGRTPTPTAPHGNYGAHWWRLSHGSTLPSDLFFASGFEGQKIVVIPSRQLVIVQLGLAYFSDGIPFEYTRDIIEAFPAGEIPE